MSAERTVIRPACKQVQLGLMKLQADKTFDLLQQASLVIFDDVPPPPDRWDAMKQYPEASTTEKPEWCLQLNGLDHAYWANPDGLNEHLVAFAEQQGLIQPFSTSNEQ